MVPTMVCLGYSLCFPDSQMDSYWLHEAPPTQRIFLIIIYLFIFISDSV